MYSCTTHGKDECPPWPAPGAYASACYGALKREVARLDQRIADLTKQLSAEQVANGELRKGLGADVPEGVVENLSETCRKNSIEIVQLRDQLKQRTEMIDAARKSYAESIAFEKEQWREASAKAIRERDAAYQANEKYAALFAERERAMAQPSTFASVEDDERVVALTERLQASQGAFTALQSKCDALEIKADIWERAFRIAHGASA